MVSIKFFIVETKVGRATLKTVQHHLVNILLFFYYELDALEISVVDNSIVDLNIIQHEQNVSLRNNHICSLFIFVYSLIQKIFAQHPLYDIAPDVKEMQQIALTKTSVLMELAFFERGQKMNRRSK